MFQLILGISLGIILLFVILLLVTEVAATYPVWKHFDKNLSYPAEQAAARTGKRNLPKFFLLVLAALGLLIMLAYFFSSYRNRQEALPEPYPENKLKATVLTKLLESRTAGPSLLFRLQTKWEDGKLYGNSTVSIQNDSAWRFAECKYYLLDRDGFLVKELLFSHNDFAFETGPGGEIRGLANKFNTEIRLSEYRKIEKLEVVLDKKISRGEQGNR